MPRSVGARATLAEIANRAGVSVATVSYVLNDKQPGRIPEATKQRVRTIAEGLGYVPNAAAQALRTGRSRVVLIIIPNLPLNFAMGELMICFGRELDAHGYIAVMFTTGDRKMDLEARVNATAPVAAYSFAQLADDELRLLDARGIVLMGGALSTVNNTEPWSRELQRRLIERQLEHLVSLGHTHIGWAHPKDRRLAGLAKFRLDCARAWIKAQGLAAPVVQAFPLSGAAADVAVAAWMASGITAVACYNDLWAMAVVEAARRAGVSVPGSLAVIGIDNTPLTSIVEPPVTSISIDADKNVREIVRILVARVSGEQPAPPANLDKLIKFVRRGST